MVCRPWAASTFSLSLSFLIWTIFEVFIEFVTILLLFYGFVIFWPGGMWDLSPPDQGLNPHLLYWKAKS